MTIVRRTTPFGELLTLRRAMDRIFDEDAFRPFQWTPGGLEARPLPLDVTTSKDAVRIEASLPGVKPEDVSITVENGVLTITGKTAEEHLTDEGSYLVQEIRRGEISRSVTLPDGLEADKATATFEHGMLRLRIPKAEAVKPRQIRISPVTDGTPAVTAGTKQA